MFGRKQIKRLTQERNRAEGVATERMDAILDLQKRLNEVHRRLLAQRDETTRAYAETARLRLQQVDLTEHLRHALADRDALQEQVDRLVVELTAVAEPAPLPRLSAVEPCAKCGGSRKFDAGDDFLGEVIIPCPMCCCICGDYTGGGLCEADKEESP